MHTQVKYNVELDINWEAPEQHKLNQTSCLSSAQLCENPLQTIDHLLTLVHRQVNSPVSCFSLSIDQTTTNVIHQINYKSRMAGVNLGAGPGDGGWRNILPSPTGTHQADLKTGTRFMDQNIVKDLKSLFPPIRKPEEKLKLILWNRNIKHICGWIIMEAAWQPALAAFAVMSLNEASEPQIAPDAGSSVGKYAWLPAPDEQVAPCRETAATDETTHDVK